TRIEKKPNNIEVSYVFSATLRNQPDRPQHGYGESRFAIMPAKNLIIDGSGYYTAAEEMTPFSCPYNLRRIDRDFKHMVGADNETLEDEESEVRFVKLVHVYYTKQRKAPTS